MNNTRVFETLPPFGGGGRRGRKRRDLFVRFSHAFLAASVTLSSINSPMATVLAALLFALLAGWLKARTLRAARARALLEAEGICWPGGWRAGVTHFWSGDVTTDADRHVDRPPPPRRSKSDVAHNRSILQSRHVGPSIVSSANER